MPDIINRISQDLNVEIEILETKSYEEARDLIEKGEFVVVDTSRGLECGKVVLEIREIPEAEIPAICNNFSMPLIRKIHRKATKADLARLRDNRESEKKAFDICLKKISEHGLPMKLINVNYTFDMAKIIWLKRKSSARLFCFIKSRVFIMTIKDI